MLLTQYHDVNSLCWSPSYVGQVHVFSPHLIQFCALSRSKQGSACERIGAPAAQMCPGFSASLLHLQPEPASSDCSALSLPGLEKQEDSMAPHHRWCAQHQEASRVISWLSVKPVGSSSRLSGRKTDPKVTFTVTQQSAVAPCAILCCPLSSLSALGEI